jgi:hypothetical protein
MIRPSFLSVPSVVRFLYTQNPFYLIGTFLILFGLQQSLGSDPRLSASGMLVAFLAAYTLALAAVAALVIRYGQVWEDARTILLVIVLLFFMLSTSLDVHLLYMPLAGTVLLAGGLALAIGVSEALLRGLRIGLAARYRGPYYLVLALLFTYPVALAWLSYFALYDFVSWLLLAFPALGAVALLTLLPAARTRPWREPPSNTPWKWPYYPWSLFVFLTVGLAIRSYWLTVAFEPTKGEEGCFAPYFLSPLVLAWSALVLEMGKARRSRGALAAGLALPAAALTLAFAGVGSAPVQLGLFSRLTGSLGSPAQLVVWSLGAYYAWAWLRGARAAEGCLIGVGLAASVVGRQTVDLATLTQPQLLPLAAVASGLATLAIWKQSTWRALACAAMFAAAALLAGFKLEEGSFWFWQWHAPLLAVLAIAAVFRDELAQKLREIAWRVTPGLALAAAVVYPWSLPFVSALTLAAYLALMLVLSIALWQRQREVAPLASVLMTLAANVLAHARHVYLLLSETELAAGLPWLAGGSLVVALAVLISLIKMGLWEHSGRWLAQVNQVLSGPKEAKPL